MTGRLSDRSPSVDKIFLLSEAETLIPIGALQSFG